MAEHAATLDHMLGGRLNVAFVRGYQARWFEYVAVPGVEATGPWNRKMTEDDVNRELFEECVDIIKTPGATTPLAIREILVFPVEGRKIPMTIRSMDIWTGIDPDGPSGPWALPQTLARPYSPLLAAYAQSPDLALLGT